MGLAHLRCLVTVLNSDSPMQNCNCLTFSTQVDHAAADPATTSVAKAVNWLYSNSNCQCLLCHSKMMLVKSNPCPPHQICTTSPTTSCPSLQYWPLLHLAGAPLSYIFLDGQHSFDSTDLVQVNNVRYNLMTLMGQGRQSCPQVAGPEETVMQSILSVINSTNSMIFALVLHYFI